MTEQKIFEKRNKDQRQEIKNMKKERKERVKQCYERVGETKQNKIGETKKCLIKERREKTQRVKRKIISGDTDIYISERACKRKEEERMKTWSGVKAEI